MFRRESDFQAFERVLHEAHQRHPLRILSYCVMPSHWHFVVWPQKDDQVTNFFRWLAHTHAYALGACRTTPSATATSTRAGSKVFRFKMTNTF